MQRIVAALLLAMSSAATPALAQADAAPAPYVRPEPPGQLVEVALGRRLHILCEGEGQGPTVIIEAGMAQYTANTAYGRTQDLIAPFARVCTYDRAGLGWSDPQPESWTHDAMAADLHALLDAAEIEGPVLLVAHSMGGVIAQVYARAYPDEVAGLILVDAVADGDFAELEASFAASAASLEEAVAKPPGVPVTPMPAGTPAEVVMAYTPEIFRGVRTEVQAMLGMPAERRQARPGALADLKLIVIARGKMADPPTESDLAHRKGQEALTALSTDRLFLVAEGSGHAIPLEAAEVVADATYQMLGALRDDTPLR